MSSKSSAVPRIKALWWTSDRSSNSTMRVDVAFTCQDTIQVPATTSSRGQQEEETHHCWMAAKMSLRVHTACLGPALSTVLTGRAAPSLANDRKRFKLYQQFWQLLKELGLWDHPTYLARKGLVTHPSDRREIMPINVHTLLKVN
ncbi:hypothetical protein EMCRGX_G033043 [Ephydatia muelleri]